LEEQKVVDEKTESANKQKALWEKAFAMVDETYDFVIRAGK